LLAARRRLGVDATRAVGLRLCDSLGHAHAHGVIHRDIKPGNVFVARVEGKEFIKLFDFGIARFERATSKKLTAQGTVMGTPEYMSPEQLHASEEIDARSDIYALGVTLYECLTGTVPFEGHYADVLLKSATQPLPRVRSLNAEVPADLAEAIETALEFHPPRRHQTMRAFAESLVGGGAARETGSLLAGTSGRPLTAERMSGPAVAQRRFPRAPYVTPVRVMRPDGSSIDGRSEDVSVGGLLTVLKDSCAAGELVRVRFALPILGKIAEIEATTRWIRTARGKDAVGLEFRAITSEAHDAISRYVTAMGAT
jgi:serine/threonine protein kinase